MKNDFQGVCTNDVCTNDVCTNTETYIPYKTYLQKIPSKHTYKKYLQNIHTRTILQYLESLETQAQPYRGPLHERCSPIRLVFALEELSRTSIVPQYQYE